MELDPPSTNLLKRPVSPAQPETNGTSLHHAEDVPGQIKKAKLDTASATQTDKAAESVPESNGKEHTHRKGQAPVKRESVLLSSVLLPNARANTIICTDISSLIHRPTRTQLRLPSPSQTTMKQKQNPKQTRSMIETSEVA